MFLVLPLWLLPRRKNIQFDILILDTLKIKLLDTLKVNTCLNAFKGISISWEYNHLNKISCNFTEKACKFTIRRLKHNKLPGNYWKKRTLQQSAFDRVRFYERFRLCLAAIGNFSLVVQIVIYRPKNLQQWDSKIDFLSEDFPKLLQRGLVFRRTHCGRAFFTKTEELNYEFRMRYL